MVREETAFFAKVHLKAPTPLYQLLAQRVLLPRDLAVLYCMVEMMNPRSGRIEIRPSVLAEKLGMRLPDITHTLKRLREAHVMVQQKDRDTGGYYYLVCPQYVSVGTDQKRGYLGAQFAEVMQQEYDSGRMPPIGGLTALGAS